MIQYTTCSTPAFVPFMPKVLVNAWLASLLPLHYNKTTANNIL